MTCRVTELLSTSFLKHPNLIIRLLESLNEGGNLKEGRLKELCGSKSHKECQSSHPTAGLTNPHFEGQPATKGP